MRYAALLDNAATEFNLVEATKTVLSTSGQSHHTLNVESRVRIPLGRQTALSTSGSSHHPFTVESRVRIPLGLHFPLGDGTSHQPMIRGFRLCTITQSPYGILGEESPRMWFWEKNRPCCVYGLDTHGSFSTGFSSSLWSVCRCGEVVGV